MTIIEPELRTAPSEGDVIVTVVEDVIALPQLGIAIHPSTNAVYVTNAGSNNISIINGAPENTASTSVSFTITAPDTIPPVITLLGNNPASAECGSSYNDAGATAQDEPDGNGGAGAEPPDTI